MMGQGIKISSTNLDTESLTNPSSFDPTQNQKKEVPIQWEVVQREYDSGPKMGID